MNRMLDEIQSPKDLKRLKLNQLYELAEEIRQFIIANVAVTGGHLAPSLGVVELTIALHRVLNTPTDKIVWDVGHQAYVHKILTGRKDQFKTLRQYGGLCGFPKRSESPHDAFGAGHSSTSVSAAAGLAVARDLAGKKHHIAAVIGDGSLTGGQAYEALNHVGHIGTRMMVILNDNEMSIAPNVGAISKYLTRLRTAPTYGKIKGDLEYILKRIPAIGPQMAKNVERLKDALKHIVVPGIFFKELGFNYIGPIDGHDLFELEEVLNNAKNMAYPTLVHVITQKGKGYKPAEEKADKFHGVGPFCVDSGELIKCSSERTFTSVFGDTLVELAEKDERIIAITAAMPEGTGLRKFANTFPKRFFDVGIAEPHAVTFATGLATQGYRPVVAVYSTFMQRAYDHIIHDAALQKLPVVFALDRAGIVGEDGATHQGVFDLSFLRHIPNLVVMAPKDENELRHMLKTATEIEGPTVIRYPRGKGTGMALDKVLYSIETGRWERLLEGDDVVLLATGAMVYPALEAAKDLETKGLKIGVINARFIKPLDEELLRSVCRNGSMLVTVEDNVLAGGFGSSIAEFLERSGFIKTKLKRLGLPDEFIEHGPRDVLLKKYKLDANGIALQVAEFYKQMGVR